MSEETWMIERVGVGARDVGTPVLWFDVVDGMAAGALQVMRLDDERATELLSAAYEVHSLNGRMCRVENTDGTVRFLRLLPAAKVNP